MDLNSVPQDLNETDRNKKKELTGAVWTQINYKINKENETIEYQQAKNEIGLSNNNKLIKINENEVLMVT